MGERIIIVRNVVSCARSEHFSLTSFDNRRCDVFQPFKRMVTGFGVLLNVNAAMTSGNQRLKKTRRRRRKLAPVKTPEWKRDAEYQLHLSASLSMHKFRVTPSGGIPQETHA